MRNILLAILLISTITSCEEYEDYYNVESLQQDSKIVLYAFPTTSDTIIIDISASTPVFGETKKLNVSSVQCLVNGVADSVSLQSKGSADPYYNPMLYPYERMYYRYVATGKHSAGDTIAIEVSADGFKKVSASTVIPEKVTVRNVREEVSYYDNSALSMLLFSFDDASPQEDYYSLALKRWYLDYESPSDSTGCYLEINTSTEPMLREYSLSSSNPEDAIHYFFNDKQFSNSVCNMHANYYSSNYEMVKHELQFNHLSKELYQYMKSWADYDDNNLSQYGMAFAYRTYTNVKGGYGVVAAYNSVKECY